jgi:hypothetical protein
MIRGARGAQHGRAIRACVRIVLFIDLGRISEVLASLARRDASSSASSLPRCGCPTSRSYGGGLSQRVGVNDGGA